MRFQVIVRKSTDNPPEQEVNEAIKKLGRGWSVCSAVTTMLLLPGPIRKAPIMVDRDNILYVTTVVAQKR